MAKRKPVGWRGEPGRHREAALKGKRSKGIKRNPTLMSRRKLGGATFTRHVASYSKGVAQNEAAKLRKRGYNARVVPGHDRIGNRIFTVYKRSKKNPVPYR